jgi:hypothetical protein
MRTEAKLRAAKKTGRRLEGVSASLFSSPGEFKALRKQGLGQEELFRHRRPILVGYLIADILYRHTAILRQRP